MARKAAVAPVVPEVEEEDYTRYANKPPTALMTRMVEWVPRVTGYDPNSAKSKQQAFEDGVRLCVFLRMHYQACAENRAANLLSREANALKRLPGAAVVEEPAPAPVPAKRAARKTAAAAAPAVPPAKAAAATRKPRAPRPATAVEAAF